MYCKNHPEVVDRLTKCSGCGQFFCPDCVVELKGQTYCADCKSEAVKDIQSGVPVDGSEMKLATIGARFAAIFLDGLVLAVPTYAIAFGVTFLIIGTSVAPGQAQLSILFNILVGFVAVIPAIIYEALMLTNRGQTLGKMALGIKVVTPDGQNITAGQAWTRPLVRGLLGVVPFAVGALINYLSAFSKERTCVHDMVAKTRVVKIR